MNPTVDKKRRLILNVSAAFAGGLLLPNAQAIQVAQPANGRMILVFLRGGLDGLQAIAPVSDPRLNELRPTLASPFASGGLALGNSGFAAHPSCAALAELYAKRELAFAPCFGTVDRSRSHFQAQDRFELGDGGTQGSRGLLARAAEAAGEHVRTVGFVASEPLILRGGRGELIPLTGKGLQVRHDRALEAIRKMHQQQASGAVIEQALETQTELDNIAGMDAKAARGAGAASGFPKTAATMAQMLKNDTRISMAFIDIGGFDTHANENAALTRSLTALGDGVLALRDGLGPNEWRRTQILICSEFGRTVRENGTRGSDHGHGGLALLAGGAINGGRQIGDFPGLSDTALNEKRDLPVIVDWRTLLGQVLSETQGFNRASLQRILPGMPGLA